jgi:hypothetical protein
MTIFNISLLEEKKQFDEVFMSKKPSNVKDIIPEIELRLNVFGFNKQTKERFKKIGLFKSTWESTLNRVMKPLSDKHTAQANKIVGKFISLLKTVHN